MPHESSRAGSGSVELFLFNTAGQVPPTNNPVQYGVQPGIPEPTSTNQSDVTVQCIGDLRQDAATDPTVVLSIQDMGVRAGQGASETMPSEQPAARLLVKRTNFTPVSGSVVNDSAGTGLVTNFAQWGATSTRRVDSTAEILTHTDDTQLMAYVWYDSTPGIEAQKLSLSQYDPLIDSDWREVYNALLNTALADAPDVDTAEILPGVGLSLYAQGSDVLLALPIKDAFLSGSNWYSVQIIRFSGIGSATVSAALAGGMNYLTYQPIHVSGVHDDTGTLLAIGSGLGEVHFARSADLRTWDTISSTAVLPAVSRFVAANAQFDGGITDTFFIGSQGWCCTSGGEIGVSDDRGRSWWRVSTPTRAGMHTGANRAYPLYRVYAISNGASPPVYTVWACGAEGMLLKSSDSGATWYILKLPNSLKGGDREFYKATAASAGQYGTVAQYNVADWLGSTNAVLWPSRDLYAMCWSSASIGYVAGEGGLLMRTADAGVTWTKIKDWGSTGAYRDMVADSSHNVLLIGSDHVHDVAEVATAGGSRTSRVMLAKSTDSTATYTFYVNGTDVASDNFAIGATTYKSTALGHNINRTGLTPGHVTRPTTNVALTHADSICYLLTHGVVIRWDGDGTTGTVTKILEIPPMQPTASFGRGTVSNQGTDLSSISGTGRGNAITSGSSTTVTFSDSTMPDDLEAGYIMVANSLTRTIDSVNTTANTVTLTSAVDWDNGGVGYAFTYTAPKVLLVSTSTTVYRSTNADGSATFTTEAGPSDTRSIWYFTSIVGCLGAARGKMYYALQVSSKLARPILHVTPGGALLCAMANLTRWQIELYRKSSPASLDPFESVSGSMRFNTVGRGNVKTTGSSVTASFVTDAMFDDIQVGYQITANSLMRTVTAVNTGPRTVTLDTAVNWDNTGAGYAFTFIGNGNAMGAMGGRPQGFTRDVLMPSLCTDDDNQIILTAGTSGRASRDDGRSWLAPTDASLSVPLGTLAAISPSVTTDVYGWRRTFAAMNRLWSTVSGGTTGNYAFHTYTAREWGGATTAARAITPGKPIWILDDFWVSFNGDPVPGDSWTIAPRFDHRVELLTEPSPSQFWRSKGGGTGDENVVTAGSSTTATTSNSAFADVQVNGIIVANRIARVVGAKASSESLTLATAVNWDNSQVGYPFTYHEPDVTHLIDRQSTSGIAALGTGTHFLVHGAALFGSNLHTIRVAVSRSTYDSATWPSGAADYITKTISNIIETGTSTANPASGNMVCDSSKAWVDNVWGTGVRQHYIGFDTDADGRLDLVYKIVRSTGTWLELEKNDGFSVASCAYSIFPDRFFWDGTDGTLDGASVNLQDSDYGMCRLVRIIVPAQVTAEGYYRMGTPIIGPYPDMAAISGETRHRFSVGFGWVPITNTSEQTGITGVTNVRHYGRTGQRWRLPYPAQQGDDRDRTLNWLLPKMRQPFCLVFDPSTTTTATRSAELVQVVDAAEYENISGDRFGHQLQLKEIV